MKLHCPHCGVKGSAEDSYSGRKIKCPKCQGMFELQPEMALDVSEDAALSSSSSSLVDPVTEALAEEPQETESVDDISEEEAEIGLEEPVPAADLEEEETAEDDQLDWDDVASEVDLEEVDDELEEAVEDDNVEVDSRASDEEDSDPHAIDELEEEPEGETETDTLDLAGDVDDTDQPGLNGDDGLEQELEEKIVEEALEESPAEELFDAKALEQELEELVDDSLDDTDLAVAAVPAAAVAAAALVGETDTDREEPTEGLSEEVEADPADSDVSEDAAVQEEDEEQVELEPYDTEEGECWQCGKKESGEEPFVAKEGRLYCSDCFPVDMPETPEDPEVVVPGGLPETEELAEEDTAAVPVKKFSIGEVISTAWAEIKGAKGVIWAGSAIMYLVLLVLVAGSAFFLPVLDGQQLGVSGPLVNIVFQCLSTIFSVLFTAGLIYMGIKKVAGEPVSWKMIFKGFSCSGKIIIATILQTILVSIGLVLLILPGIYLAVGYAMVLPLIVDKGLSPWQAMETSRKAVHKVWWRMVGLYLLMGLIIGISCVPLGIGLIWTWPMFIVVIGVVYWRLFGAEDEEG